MLLRIIILCTLWSQLAWTKADCQLAFFASSAQQSALLKKYQGELVEYLRRQQLPAFYRRIGERQVPVILINEDTYPKLASRLNDSYGQSIQLKPGLGNGHGMLLVGARDFSHRTYWTPQMGPRENRIIGMHDSYVEVLDFAALVSKAQSTFAIFSYPMTSLERTIADRYLKVRRAGLFHVPSGFNSNEPIPQAFQRLCTRGEKCYDYIAGTVAHQDSINAMKYHLWEYNGKRMDADQFLEQAEVQELTKLMNQQLDQLHINQFLPDDLALPMDQIGMSTMFHPRMMERPELMDRVARLLPQDTSRDTKLKVLNLILGVDALSDYSALMRHMGLNHYNVWPDHIGGSQRLGAIYILHNKSYRPTAADYQKQVVERFLSGRYENLFGASQHHLGDAANWHTPLK